MLSLLASPLATATSSSSAESQASAQESAVRRFRMHLFQVSVPIYSTVAFLYFYT